MNQTVKKTGSTKARNSAARLLAVQAVYQMHKNDQDSESIIKEFLEHRTGMDADGDEMVTPNQDHFALVVRGVNEHVEQLTDMIAKNRNQKEAQPPKAEVDPKVQRLQRAQKTPETEEVSPEVSAPLAAKKEPLLQAILLCGAFELMVLQAIDSPVIISDYIHVTKAFYEDGESKLVNGLLDSMRKTVRD